MSKLLLVRHSEPDTTFGASPAEQPLSEEGRRRCRWLAEELRLNLVTQVFSSEAASTRETAALVAEQLELTAEARSGLHEIDHAKVATTPAENFKRRLAGYFSRPDRSQIGEETAQAAHARFTAALNVLLDEAPGENVAVVTHPGVISLMAAAGSKARAFDVWERLAAPSYIVLQRETFTFGGAIRNFTP